MRHCIVPPYLLERIAVLDGDAARPAVVAARRALRGTQFLHRVRHGIMEQPGLEHSVERSDPGLHRTISDAENLEELPGRQVRDEGDAPTGDPAADEAYDYLGDTYAFFADAYSRDSLDGNGLGLLATVHFGNDYENAFWEGTRMVFGDGDGVIFNRFTSSLTVIAHELTHGLTQFTTQLRYQDQAGALHESIADVFGALTEQHRGRQSAAEASWLIGAELFTENVNGAALRSLKAPGTAFDDPRLGKDPQPATMDGYIVTDEDNGGVHLNSGIPNRAFYLLAAALGGFAWERAGQIWYDAVIGGGLPADCDFVTFAGATASAAAARFGAGSEEDLAVRGSWTDVGVQLPSDIGGAGGSSGVSEGGSAP